MILSTLIKLGKYSVLLKAQVMKKLDVRSSGVSSRIPKTSLHVTFLDYDNIDNERLNEELQFLQQQFHLGNFYVFKTRHNGRHAICLDALLFKDVLEIIQFSNCDLMFKKAHAINEYRCWVLRFTKKAKRDAPKFLYALESNYDGVNLQSRSHAKYLEIFGLKIDLKNPIGPEEIEIQHYNTGKRTE